MDMKTAHRLQGEPFSEGKKEDRPEEWFNVWTTIA
jgi:hypothetical protein